MRIPALAVVLALVLSSCANPPSPVAPLDYAQLGKINLDVKDLSFVDRGVDVPPSSPVITNQFTPTIADAIHQWASGRLQAVGTSGEAAFVVKNAYVTEQTKSVDSGWFERAQAGKLVGHVEVEFEARGREGAALATANVERAVSLPENASDDEKQDAYSALLNGIMKDLDKYLDQAIHEHMKDFIVSAPVIGSKLSPETVPESPNQSP